MKRGNNQHSGYASVTANIVYYKINSSTENDHAVNESYAH